jgi:hypothetical protein
MSTTRGTARPATTATTKKPAKKAPRRRNDPRRGNDRVTATSRRLTFAVDDRPHLDLHAHVTGQLDVVLEDAVPPARSRFRSSQTRPSVEL